MIDRAEIRCRRSLPGEIGDGLLFGANISSGKVLGHLLAMNF
jgi:hypothetical protein